MNKTTIRISTLMVAFSLLFTAFGLRSYAASTPVNTYSKPGSQKFTNMIESDGSINFGDYSISNKARVLGALYQLWPSAILPYRFAANLDANKRQKFIDTCNKWSVNTPIKCQAWSGNGPYFTVRERTSTECGDDIRNSPFQVSCTNGLGAPLANEERYLSVHPQSWDSTILLQHEIGHIIGFMHEQQRSDREDYLIYNPNNVIFDYRGVHSDNTAQFRMYPNTNYYSEYDYNSIMHYWNCAFTSPASGCLDNGDFNIQAIAPRQCDKHAIGYINNPAGPQITVLDQQSVQKAYMSRLMAVFKEERDAQCGTQILSPQQVNLVCGPACSQASPIQWTRIAKGYSQEWCTGAFTVPLPNGTADCARFGQDYYGQKSNSTKWVDKCWTQIANQAELNERWNECGCRSQTLASLCVAEEAPFDHEATIKLLSSKYWRDRSAAALLLKIDHLKKQDLISKNAELSLISILKREYIRVYFGKRGRNLVQRINRYGTTRAGSGKLLDIQSVKEFALKSRLSSK